MKDPDYINWEWALERPSEFIENYTYEDLHPFTEQPELNQELLDKLKIALEGLTERQQEIYQLIYVQGLTQVQAASKLGIGQSSISLMLNNKKFGILARLKYIIEAKCATCNGFMPVELFGKSRFPVTCSDKCRIKRKSTEQLKYYHAVVKVKNAKANR